MISSRPDVHMAQVWMMYSVKVRTCLEVCWRTGKTGKTGYACPTAWPSVQEATARPVPSPSQSVAVGKRKAGKHRGCTM